MLTGGACRAMGTARLNKEFPDPKEAEKYFHQSEPEQETLPASTIQDPCDEREMSSPSQIAEI